MTENIGVILREGSTWVCGKWKRNKAIKTAKVMCNPRI